MLRGLSIGGRLVLTFAAILVLGGGLAGLGLAELHRNLLLDRKEKTRSLVESARGIAVQFHARAQAGEMTDTEARAAALRLIGGLRYGAAGKDYLWVNDAQGTFLAHPTQAGATALDTRDVNGVPYMREFIAASARGGDFVPYHWVRDAGRPAVAKISYVAPFAPWGWTIGTGIYIDDVRAVFLRTLAVVGGAAALGLALLAVVGLLFARSLVVPIRRLTAGMAAIAGGDLSTRIDVGTRRDEIGSMVRSFDGLRASLAHAHEVEAARRAEQEAKTARAARISQLTSSFEGVITAAITQLAGSAAELEASATSMSQAARETQQQSTTVAGATGQASANVQAVAGATEQMSASGLEIAQQIEQASSMANGAVAEADQTVAAVDRLAGSVQKISAVVELIRQIAGQTNLLALNATIEAARAGEAGKGFAVVATEVKSLASQTARATEEIGSQIEQVQRATNSTVAAARAISGKIGEINQVSASIAAAVQQQGAATSEISSNVQQAALGTNEISRSISEVAGTADRTGREASSVLSIAGRLSRQAGELRTEVGGFLAALHAA